MNVGTEIHKLISEINHLRALLDDANGRIHALRSMMREAGFPDHIKLGEDLHGNEDWVSVKPEAQLRDLLADRDRWRERALDHISPVPTPKTFQKEIAATHPMENGAGELELSADMLAMKLVGERHEKRDLVNLVRWLILRRPQGLL